MGQSFDEPGLAPEIVAHDLLNFYHIARVVELFVEIVRLLLLSTDKFLHFIHKMCLVIL